MALSIITPPLVAMIWGGGGNRSVDSATRSGGASCQHYDSITLTKKDSVSVVIGDYNNASTSFGPYSVMNGGSANAYSPGTGTGNKGKNGSNYPFGVKDQNTYGTGTLSQQYGWGAGWDAEPGPRAVYLKYLGA